jgi:DNA (cytosine-5)-methyltransferase 1
MTKTLNILDLFSGVGGLSTGFKQAGYTALAALDYKPEAVQTYQYNHPNTNVILQNIRKTNAKQVIKKTTSTLDDIDVIIGGPPCEGFSTVGYRRPEDPRNSLFYEFARFVEDVQPKAFVIENVPGLLSMKQGTIIQQVLTFIEDELHYQPTLEVLNAVDYGVPQIRKRVFIVALKNHQRFTFPTRTHREKSPQRRLPVPDTADQFYLTVEDALSDLPSLKAGEGIEEQPYPTQPNTEYQKARRKGSERLFDHIAINHSKLIRQRIQLISQGGNHGDLPANLQLKSGYPNIYGRLVWHQPSSTLTGNCGCVSAPGRFIHPLDDRVLTVREAARIQSFDDLYRFFGSRTMKYKLIGDAVPPLLARTLAQQLRTFL